MLVWLALLRAALSTGTRFLLVLLERQPLTIAVERRYARVRVGAICALARSLLLPKVLYK